MMMYIRWSSHVRRQVFGGIVFRQSPLFGVDVVSQQAGSNGGGAEGDDAKLTVTIRANGIVDTRDHLGDIKDMTRDLRGHDIPVVALCDGNKNLGMFDAGAAQYVLVNAVADDTA